MDKWTTHWPRKSYRAYAPYGQHLDTSLPSPGDNYRFVNYFEYDPFTANAGFIRISEIDTGLAYDQKIGDEVTYGKLYWKMAMAAYPMYGLNMIPDFFDPNEDPSMESLSRVSYRLVIMRFPVLSENSSALSIWNLKLADIFEPDSSPSPGDYLGFRCFPAITQPFNRKNYGMFDILHDQVYTCSNSEPQKYVEGCIDLTGMKAVDRRLPPPEAYIKKSSTNQIFACVVATSMNTRGVQDWGDWWPYTHFSSELEFFDR